MKTYPNFSFLISIAFFLIVTTNLHGQNTEKTLLISKISKPEKVRRIATGTRLKIQTISGDYVKTKLNSFGRDYLLTEQQDTVYFRNIYSLKAQRKLNKAEFFVGVPILVTGVLATVVGIPLGIILILMQEAGSGIFFVPLAGIVFTVTGVKLIGRKTYNTKNWIISTTL